MWLSWWYWFVLWCFLVIWDGWVFLCLDIWCVVGWVWCFWICCGWGMSFVIVVCLCWFFFGCSCWDGGLVFRWFFCCVCVGWLWFWGWLMMWLFSLCVFLWLCWCLCRWWWYGWDVYCRMLRICWLGSWGWVSRLCWDWVLGFVCLGLGFLWFCLWSVCWWWLVFVCCDCGWSGLFWVNLLCSCLFCWLVFVVWCLCSSGWLVWFFYGWVMFWCVFLV